MTVGTIAATLFCICICMGVMLINNVARRREKRHRACAFILESLQANGPLFGLDLIEASDGLLRRGTVYVVLMRMEQDGVIKSRPSSSPPNRRIFHLTGHPLYPPPADHQEKR